MLSADHLYVGFDKYFRVSEYQKNEQSEYYRDQYRKFFLLYCYIAPYYSSVAKGKEDFLKELAEEQEKEAQGK